MPVIWTLENVIFDSGPALSGTFIFDAHTGEYSNLDVVGSFNNLEAYNPYSGPTSLHAIVPGAPPPFVMELDFSGSLTNAGGTYEVSGYDVELARNWGEEAFVRNIVSGTVTAVPVPAAAWLFGSALAGLGLLRRKQTA
ncbi:VPLPA-CTERM sorting domain-containing protein [Gammaproteobacteria bacterium]|nr:VPLPA-CTERM sorting domain-containing protein [Gammaproteobacteria bacterium]